MTATDPIARPLTFRFDADAAETVRASREVQRVRGSRWLAYLTWPMLVLLAVMYLLDGARLRDLWLLGLVALMLIAFEVGTPLIQRWQLRRLYQGTPALREPQVYTVSEKGLEVSSGVTNVSLDWSAFVRAAESREFFLLFYNPRSAYYLPKRVIGAGDEAELRALIASRLGLPPAKRGIRR